MCLKVKNKIQNEAICEAFYQTLLTPSLGILIRN
jgi:hypothetical protein